MHSETFSLPGGVPLEMLPVPGVGLVGKFPITQAQWRAVMGENPSHFTGDDLPVETVSWRDCQRFCTELVALTGREFRLPTSAEWEIALARQEVSLETGWFRDNADGGTHPVGQLEPNAFGLFDMFGNVWGWCEDGEEDGRYLRGGSWFDDHHFARAAYRFIIHPADRGIVVGCRVVVARPPVRPADSLSLAAIVEQLTLCDYQCEAGPLTGNTAFIELCEMAKLVSVRPTNRIEIDKCVAAIRYHFARARDGQRDRPTCRRFVELEMGTLAEIMPVDEFASLRREVDEAWGRMFGEETK